MFCVLATKKKRQKIVALLNGCSENIDTVFIFSLAAQVNAIVEIKGHVREVPHPWNS